DTPADPDGAGDPSVRRRRRRGLVLLLLAPVVLVVGLFGMLVYSVINGFTGAPPDLVASEPVPVDDDGTIVLDGDWPYVVVDERRAAGTASADAGPESASDPDGVSSSADPEEVPVCTVTDPAGDEVEVELAANWSLGGGSALARFYAEDEGRHTISCVHDGDARPLAVADDGSWEWDREREADERRGVVLVVIVFVAAIGLCVAGVRLRRRR
ncbi:MAG: hypothetical protein ACTMKU_08035, partial [Actinomycetaceae bacterium]